MATAFRGLADDALKQPNIGDPRLVCRAMLRAAFGLAFEKKSGTKKPLQCSPPPFLSSRPSMLSAEAREGAALRRGYLPSPEEELQSGLAVFLTVFEDMTMTISNVSRR